MPRTCAGCGFAEDPETVGYCLNCGSIEWHGLPEYRFSMCDCGKEPLHGYFFHEGDHILFPVFSKEGARNMLEFLCSEGRVPMGFKDLIEKQIKETEESVLPEKINQSSAMVVRFTDDGGIVKVLVL